MSITAAGLVSAVAEATVPQGRGKAAVRLACGLMVVAALFSFFPSFSLENVNLSVASFTEAAEEAAETGEQDRKYMERAYIESRLSEYIISKAHSLGVNNIQVRVHCAWDSRGCWYPDRVEVASDCDGDTAGRLGNVISTELGVSAKNQQWRAYENG